VAKKPDFLCIQRKIPQKSDIAKKWDSNSVPYGYIKVDIAKNFCSIFFAKIGFCNKKTQFLRKSDWETANFPKIFEKIKFSNKKTRFLQKYERDFAKNQQKRRFEQ
jgi:hypothetical protein